MTAKSHRASLRAGRAVGCPPGRSRRSPGARRLADVIMVARSETRTARPTQAVAALASRSGPCCFPHGTASPMTAASPSRTVMGARMEVLHRAEHARGRACTADRFGGRGQPAIAAVLPWAALTLREGEDIDPEEVRLRLERLGYRPWGSGRGGGRRGDPGLRVYHVFLAAARLPCRDRTYRRPHHGDIGSSIL